MLTQNQIKDIRSLQQKKFRNESGQFVAEGVKLVGELIRSKYAFDSIYAKKEWIEKNSGILQEKNIPCTEVNDKELERISGLTTPNSVLAVLHIPQESAPAEIFGKELILVLDDIRDPGNLGTIIRTADWFGIKNMICSEGTVELYNPKVVQATMGSMARVNVYYIGLAKLLSEISSKTSIYGTFTTGQPIHDLRTEKNAVIVIGNESAGISEELQPFIHHKISVPPHRTIAETGAESLNASVAAAIICYEFRKPQ
jgi:RNA methyltransferase, TrmH family